jgi:hypothetical protein
MLRAEMGLQAHPTLQGGTQMVVTPSTFQQSPHVHVLQGLLDRPHTRAQLSVPFDDKIQRW